MAHPSLYYIIWQEGKYYVSQCLNVDVSSFGETRQESIDNLHEAVGLFLEEEKPPMHETIENPEIICVPNDHV
ncbi:type II toxin-antitoxin system HicB family antitoxin [Candidatus Peregrinibacteria bacterium]|nr:type II toxin-antitoxin system HicB family antitoxin [Candidatus Peregrinibacteria bacterium]